MDKLLILNSIKEYLNIRYDKDFAEYLGIKTTTLAMWYKRKSYDVELIFNKCEFINPEWLLTGKGSMLKSDAKSSLNQNITGDSNIQSGNDTNTGDSTIQVKKLQQELKECKIKLEEKDKTISQLVNLMSSK